MRLSVDIFFTRDGQLDQPRYCFQLKAFDSSIKKKTHASSNVCVIVIDEPAPNLLSTNETTLTNDTIADSSTFTNQEPKPTDTNQQLCTCDEFEDCFCGPANVTVYEDSTKTAPMATTVPQYIDAEAYKCGDSCMAMLIGIPSCALVAFLLVFFLITYWRVTKRFIEFPDGYDTRFTKQQAELAKFEVLNETQSNPGRWEIDIKRVKVERVIGEGEFGKVMLASLRSIHGGESTPVAIKTVKNIESDSEILSLKKEFEQLQKVSIRPHPNVVTLIGCYSKGSEPWIFLEYCIFESLKDYLLASRLILVPTGSDGVDKLTVDDILRFSLQIANGMSHLTELKLVHRDLAARNVLLFEGKICKISDFGLTRNVCNSCDTYSKSSDDKVPVKWLAPESLSGTEEYTTKSDVWAFGILGYELIMLGSSPYPSVAANHKEILNLLLNGCRMQRPANCSVELFSVFASCWAFEPSSRPTFEYLSRQFQDLNSNNKQSALWTTPDFSEDEKQSFDEAYYREYIDRIERARASFKAKDMKKRRKRSSAGDLLMTLSESSSLSPVAKLPKSLKSSKSLSHVDNAAYDGKYDSIKSMRRKLESVSTQTVSDLTAASTSTCSSYLTMTGIPTSSTFDVICDVEPASNFTSSGYVSVGEMLYKTGSQSSATSTLEGSISS